MNNKTQYPSGRQQPITGITIRAKPVKAKKTNHKSRFLINRFNGKFRNRFIIIAITFILFLSTLFLIAMTIGLGYYWSIQNSPQILQGVDSSGIQLGNLTTTEAAILLHKKWNLENIILINTGEIKYPVPPMEIGLRLDPIATAEKAYAYGRNGTITDRIKAFMDARFVGSEIQPVIVVDIDVARSKLSSLEPVFSKPVTEPVLIYENESLTSTKGGNGYTIDFFASLKILEENSYSILFSGSYPLQLKTLSPKITDLSSIENKAREYLEKPLVLHFYDPVINEWIEHPIPKAEIAKWISAVTTSDTPEIYIDQLKIDDYLNRINDNFPPDRYIELEAISEEIINALNGNILRTIMIKHYPTTYTVGPGDTLLRIGWNLGIPYWRIIDQNPEINPDKLTTGQVLKIPSKDELIPLPVIENKRIVISISKQRLWAYENGEQVAKEVISTGINRSPTQPGVFQVQSHIKSAYASIWDLTMPNFLGIYEAWPGFMNGIHGLPTLSNGQRLWANILGRPASYGCIIMTLDAAKWLYNWAEDGVIVEIQS
jgi:hypothetical protein